MDRELLASLLASASTAGSGDQRALTRLAGRCWPTSCDATMPVARDWVRRWGPMPIATSARLCACGSGRCDACN
jgi:hypothetical protein